MKTISTLSPTNNAILESLAFAPTSRNVSSQEPPQCILDVVSKAGDAPYNPIPVAVSAVAKHTNYLGRLIVEPSQTIGQFIQTIRIPLWHWPTNPAYGSVLKARDYNQQAQRNSVFLIPMRAALKEMVERLGLPVELTNN